MGHLIGKDIYKRLGKKIDGLGVRTPWNEKLHAILKALYTREEADLVARLPYRPSDITRIAKITQYKEDRLQKILQSLCEKGLVMDVFLRGKYYYMTSPLVIGVFEFTMMRTGGDLDTKAWAKLFHDYMSGDDAFLTQNFKEGTKISVMRALPHEGTVAETDHVEVLDYENATAIVNQSRKFSLGFCSCRHEKHHLDQKHCDIPLETCASLGKGAEFLIRNKLAREITKSQMLEHLAASREKGLVLNADNVRKRVSAICSCCGCCCNILQGITRLGYPGILVTSSFIAHVNEESCSGCGRCAKACPINAIDMVSCEDSSTKTKRMPRINNELCVGCGVCALKCSKTESLKLIPREKRVLHPETSMQRVILQCLERGTLQNQLFDDPNKMSHEILRAIVGAFLRLAPVKKALMSDTLRSRFLNAMNAGM
jgi:Na+-translocating ferredoxin:NAD+ oxidoreductase RNF subunit RnfB